MIQDAKAGEGDPMPKKKTTVKSFRPGKDRILIGTSEVWLPDFTEKYPDDDSRQVKVKIRHTPDQHVKVDKNHNSGI